MSRIPERAALCLAVAALVVAPMRLGAQQPRAVTPADYGRFETPGPAVLSPDGGWLAYVVNRVDETSDLRLRRTTAADTAEQVFAFGAGAVFTGDSRWLIHTIGLAPAEREKLEKEKKPVQTGVGLVNLATGDTVGIAAIAAFAPSPDGRFVALRGYAAEGAQGGAADLLVRELATGATQHFGSVTEFAWADEGALLALTIRSANAVGNGVHVYDAGSGRLRVLDSSSAVYRGLSWREDADDLAVLRTSTSDAWVDTAHAVLAWRSLRAASPVAYRLEADADGIARDRRISETRPLDWSDDGATLFFGLRTREAKEEPDSAAEGDAAVPESDVRVWRAADLRIEPQQRVQESQDRRATVLAAWHPEGDVVVIGTDARNDVERLEGGVHALEHDDSRYPFGARFGRPARDVDLIDVRTGERRRVLEDVSFTVAGSATGAYVAYFRDGDWWVYDVAADRHANVTGATDGSFENTDYDFPVDRLPPWGLAGWSSDDRWLLVYDEFDVWRVAPDGSGGRRLTDGRQDRVVHRVVRLDREAPGFDLGRPLYFSITGKTSKRSGYAVLRAGQAPERRVWEDARVLRLARADSADVFAWTAERFDDSPDWFTAGPMLTDARQVSALNPFLGEYAWGRAELVDFTSATGRPLQAALLYPAGYDPARRYPMIVYTYEIVSTQLHGFQAPSERSYYNYSAWTANDYFVLLPDIVYRGRDPGRSAVEAVEPAVRTVIDRGLVDPARIGLVGHSWGGYQAAYIPTQTNIFAAAVAGAPITNFLSFAGAIHWRPGIPEFSHWETGQARMEVPYWEDMDAYVRNSPAAHITALETPMLMMFGDADGTVDWHQGVEFYNFARRAGKDDFTMLVYPGEDHGLRKKENQIDYHRRILQWFGHYLKGEPAADWMSRRDGPISEPLGQGAAGARGGRGSGPR